MSNFWWLQPGWTDAVCMICGVQIWPEGDPDMGYCYNCYCQQFAEQEQRCHEDGSQNDA